MGPWVLSSSEGAGVIGFKMFAMMITFFVEHPVIRLLIIAG